MNYEEIDGDTLDRFDLKEIAQSPCNQCGNEYEEGQYIIAAKLKYRILWWHDRPTQNHPSCKSVSPAKG